MQTPLIIFEDFHWQRFLPLVYLRGLFELRCGIGELWQRVERVAAEGQEIVEAGLWCRSELANLVTEQTSRTVNASTDGQCLLLNGRGFWNLLPDVSENDTPWIGTAGANEAIACVFADTDLARQLSPEAMQDEEQSRNLLDGLPRRDVSHLVTLFDWPWDLVHFNATAVEADWRLAGLRGTRSIPPGVFLLNPGEIHIGAGSRIKPCVVIDAEEGPVWIGANVTVEPHATIQGPCHIGNNSIIQPGAIIREGCSIGPRCKVGGEIDASIIHGFSNKQHSGFLGHAYLGQWINMGADCLNSDLKNTYGTVRVPINGQEVETGQQFMGLLMGDFAKTGINVAFPTGAVVGACANVVTSTPPKFVPSLTWLDGNRSQPCDIERILVTARTMMARRDRDVTPALEAALRTLGDRAAKLERQT